MIVLDKNMAKMILNEINWHGGVCLLQLDPNDNVWARSVDDVREDRKGRFLGSAHSYADQNYRAHKDYLSEVVPMADRAKQK